MKAITEKGSATERMLSYITGHMKEKDEKVLRNILKTKDGRWFIMRLLDKTKVNCETFTGNSQTFYNEGKRSIGINLVQEITALGLDAVLLKQKAEKEYIAQQIEYKQLYMESLEADAAKKELDD